MECIFIVWMPNIYHFLLITLAWKNQCLKMVCLCLRVNHHDFMALHSMWIIFLKGKCVLVSSGNYTPVEILTRNSWEKFINYRSRLEFRHVYNFHSVYVFIFWNYIKLNLLCLSMGSLLKWRPSKSEQNELNFCSFVLVFCKCVSVVSCILFDSEVYNVV